MHRLTLIVLILLGLALRLCHLDVQSLWYDEGVTAQVARLGVGELARWTADDIQPPLYYLLTGGWLRLLNPWAGPLAYVMRWLSAAAGVALIPLVWALGRRLWNERAGLLAAAMVTISPLMVYYSQEARMYALLTALTAAAALVAVRWVGAKRSGWGVGRRLCNSGFGGAVHALFCRIRAVGIGAVLVAHLAKNRARQT